MPKKKRNTGVCKEQHALIHPILNGFFFSLLVSVVLLQIGVTEVCYVNTVR